jgi:O-antigen/teichoic acid export membrane protein
MKKKDAKNLLYLTSIQGANAILPLFVYPYVLLKIGAIFFSQIVLAESVSLFVLSFVLYGFDITGVHAVVSCKKNFDIKGLSEVFSNIFYARMLILFLCVLCIILLSCFLNKQLILLILIWILVPLSHILQSAYLCIGLEDNFIIAIYTIFSRLGCGILIFTFVESPIDLYKVPWIIGATNFLGGILSLTHIITKFKIRFVRIHLDKVVALLKNGKEIFIGNLSVALYKDSNLLILKIASGNQLYMTSYAIANKLINAFQAIVRPLTQLFFPKVIFLLKDTYKPDRNTFNIILKMTVYQLVVLFMLLVCLFIALVLIHNYTNWLAYYSYTKEIIIYFSIMLLAVFMGVCNFMFGSIGLNYLFMKKYYVYIMVLTGILSIIIGFILISYFGGIGASINFVLGELILLILIFRKYSILSFPNFYRR